VLLRGSLGVVREWFGMWIRVVRIGSMLHHTVNSAVLMHGVGKVHKTQEVAADQDPQAQDQRPALG